MGPSASGNVAPGVTFSSSAWNSDEGSVAIH
jgi:hypothetical protein